MCLKENTLLFSSRLCFMLASLPPVAVVEEPSPVTYFYGVPDALFEVVLHEPPEGIRRIPEAFVQALWQQQRFNLFGLTTTSGSAITILDPGMLNTDGGPDFRHAHVKIGDTEWHGDVEIHVASSTWFDHRHHENERYNSVVLHVTLHGDLWTGGLIRQDGTALPELVLYPRIEASLRTLLYQYFTTPANDFLCGSRWNTVPESVRNTYVRQLATERLRDKTATLAGVLPKPPLDDLLYERLFAGLGYAKNADPMRQLAQRVPLALLRQLDDPIDVEAVLFGTAGLLPAPADLLNTDRLTADYVMDLHERFERLRHRFDLVPLPRTVWQFFRLRPANFPTLRIAQAARFVAPGGILRDDAGSLLLDAIRQPRPIKALLNVLGSRPGSFWETHFRLEKATKPRNPALGSTRRQALLVNAVIPVLLVYAQHIQDIALATSIRNLLTYLPPENDEVTRRFHALGTKPANALMAQGYHQLYRTRCEHARCLSCDIGRHVLDADV